MTTKLTPHFSLEELTVSETAARRGLSNKPTPEHLKNLQKTAEGMEEVRKLLGNKVIIVSSGYRSEAVNKAVKGSKTSAHCSGWAVDFICPGFGTSQQVASFLAKNLPVTKYDQIIEEFGSWIHIGFGPGKRGQKLTARKINGKTVYTNGIT